MAEEYYIYTGEDPNGGPEFMAIHVAEIRAPGFDPKDYFYGGVTGIEQVGVIEVSGDDHLLGSYFNIG